MFLYADFLFTLVWFFSTTLLKLRSRNAAILFIWGCSMLLTIYCYFLWIWGRDLTFGMATSVVVLIAFAQIGWLGGWLALFGRLKSLAFLR